MSKQLIPIHIKDLKVGDLVFSPEWRQYDKIIKVDITTHFGQDYDTINIHWASGLGITTSIIDQTYLILIDPDTLTQA